MLRPGSGSYAGGNDWPFYHATDYGVSVLGDVPPTPYDPDGYLKSLQSDVRDLDHVILAYLSESLHTFRISCLLSSTIALGCASEKALLLLIAAYRDSLTEKMRDKFRANTDDRMIKRQFDEFRKMLESELKPRLPSDLADGLDVELAAIFDFIRTQRNDAGHPTGKTVERERAYANLVVFPLYLRKVYRLMDWIKVNPRT